MVEERQKGGGGARFVDVAVSLRAAHPAETIMKRWIEVDKSAAATPAPRCAVIILT
jgi:hypothetical protein